MLFSLESIYQELLSIQSMEREGEEEILFGSEALNRCIQTLDQLCQISTLSARVGVVIEEGEGEEEEGDHHMIHTNKKKKKRRKRHGQNGSTITLEFDDEKETT